MVDRVLQLSRRILIITDLPIGSIALLPSSIQLLRCTAEAVQDRRVGLPAILLVGGLAMMERTDQRIEWPERRLHALGVYWNVRWLSQPTGAVVETRRLELLTLSLQRRCSAN